MAKGPSWSEHEDGIVKAGREVGLTYGEINIVLPHRSPNACMVRTNILRRMNGVPSRHSRFHHDDDRWQDNARAASDRLLAAMMRVRGVA